MGRTRRSDGSGRRPSGTSADQLGGHRPGITRLQRIELSKQSELTLYEAADRAQRRIGIAVNPVRCATQQWAEPSDWTLMIEIHNRPYAVVYNREADAA
jgi:hypothetical protein